MKIHRLISLVAAVLITVFLARFFTKESDEIPQDQTHLTAADR